MLSSLVWRSSFPTMIFDTLFNFSFAVCFALSNVCINASTAAFSSGVTNPSAVTSANFVSTAAFVCSAFTTACVASDNCSVSSTPLLSASFTSGDVTDVISFILFRNKSLLVRPFGRASNTCIADDLAFSISTFILSISAFSSGVTNWSCVTSPSFILACFCTCVAASIASSTFLIFAFFKASLIVSATSWILTALLVIFTPLNTLVSVVSLKI